LKIAIVSHKGGPGKTTTAIHLAAYLQTLAPTLLLDADDEMRSAVAWSQRGAGLPFRVEPDDMAEQLMSEYVHTVIDTAQAQKVEDLRAAQAVCDLLVIPVPPSSLDVHGLGKTITALRSIGPDKFAVLFTKVSRDAAKEVTELRGLLAGVRLLTAEIPYLKAYAKAAGAGQIVSETDDKQAARAWEAYVAAGKELLA
jgi:chromosome partitioning protein